MSTNANHLISINVGPRMKKQSQRDAKALGLSASAPVRDLYEAYKSAKDGKHEESPELAEEDRQSLQASIPSQQRPF